MKYIMVQVEKPVRRVIPIIFPNEIVHKLMADAAIGMLRDHHRLNKCKVVGAGEIHIGGVNCGGKSESLKVRSKKSDAQTILGIDYFCGIT